MSLGPLGGIAASAAGAPLAQTKGSDVERAEQDSAAQARRVQADLKAENAEGIGEADGEDHETAERDADGRRLWEGPPQGQADQAEQTEPDHAPGEGRCSRDPTGRSGNLLDLTG
jgi:hypothetical protein